MTLASAQARPRLARSRARDNWAAAILLAVAVLLTDSSWEPPWALDQALRLLGFAATVVCVLGRGWCSIYIGRRNEHELVTAGPYSVVRNPLYVLSFMGVAGIGVYSGTITYTVLLPLLFAFYYRAVVAREEAEMAERLGEAFERYRAQVPRWIPDFRLWRDEDEVATRPFNVLRTLRDSAAFFIALPTFELARALHEVELLPVLLRIP